MSTITRTSDSITTEPSWIESTYDTTYESRNVLHQLVDGGVAATLMQHLPRTGTLDLMYQSREDAWAGVELLLAVDTFTLSDGDVPEVGMLFMAENVAPAIEQQTTSLWIVRLTYQELPT